MEQPYAEASCILKVNIHCPACKYRLLEVLGSVCGEYNIDINSEEGLVKVYAMVEPNLLVKALARTGYHAEVKWASIKHPRFSRNYYDNNYNYHNYPPIGYNYRSNHNPYPYQYHQQQQHALPDPMTHHHYSMSTPYNHHGWDPYYYGSDTYYYRPGPPHARYVPSYPPRENDPYDDDEPISFCSIM